MIHRKNKHALLIALAVGLLAAGCASSQTTKPKPSETSEPTSAAPSKPTVDVKMQEYGYSISGPMVAGGTMRVQNVGNEIHMIGIGKLEAGKTVGDVVSAFSKPGDPESALKGLVKEVKGPPGGFFGPGKAVELTVPDLGAGKYVFMCFIPAVGDGKPHAAKGMVANFDVTAGPAPAVSADATYQITPGGPISGPATLTPGHHILEINAAAGSAALEPTLVKLAPGKSYSDIDSAFAKIFGDTPPSKGYLADFPATILFGMHDLETIKKIFVGVDLDAGTYNFNAPDTDKQGSPDASAPKETITIQVA